MTKTIKYRCEYQPWMYAILPLLLLIAYLRRKIESCKAKAAVDYGRKGVIRPIAFYLPQYHAIPENDAWWGKGFTEWTNARKARPLFQGHYQPHVPHSDIGYYDLSDVEVMKKQVDIARKYGVYGFCFYYYHFKNGKRLLEKPIDNWLAHPEINFPFCFCWANENWTKVWDGGCQDLLMKQDYEMSNMERLMGDMMPAFKDDRYIKVDGKPMLLVYRIEDILAVKDVVKSWRRIVRSGGFEDIHLVMVQHFSEDSPLKFGMDAAAEFATIQSAPIQQYEELGIDLDSSELRGLPVRYCSVRKHHANLLPNRQYMRYKCVCPSWDNTPRRGVEGRCIIDASPADFGDFCDEAFSRTLADERLRKDGFVFVNAWNEWGEGAHLEPDEKFGYANLEQLKKAIERFSP